MRIKYLLWKEKQKKRISAMRNMARIRMERAKWKKNLLEGNMNIRRGELWSSYLKKVG